LKVRAFFIRLLFSEAQSLDTSPDGEWGLLSERRWQHSIYQKGNLKTLIPRHTEIIDELARKICKDLDIPWVGDK
jgi:hypothetical protein